MATEPKEVLKRYLDEAPEAKDLYRGITSQFGVDQASEILQKYGQPKDYQQLANALQFGSITQDEVTKQLSKGISIPLILETHGPARWKADIEGLKHGISNIPAHVERFGKQLIKEPIKTTVSMAASMAASPIIVPHMLGKNIGLWGGKNQLGGRGERGMLPLLDVAAPLLQTVSIYGHVLRGVGAATKGASVATKSKIPLGLLGTSGDAIEVGHGQVEEIFGEFGRMAWGYSPRLVQKAIQYFNGIRPSETESAAEPAPTTETPAAPITPPVTERGLAATDIGARTEGGEPLNYAEGIQAVIEGLGQYTQAAEEAEDYGFGRIVAQIGTQMGRLNPNEKGYNTAVAMGLAIQDEAAKRSIIIRGARAEGGTPTQAQVMGGLAGMPTPGQPAQLEPVASSSEFRAARSELETEIQDVIDSFPPNAIYRGQAGFLQTEQLLAQVRAATTYGELAQIDDALNALYRTQFRYGPIAEGPAAEITEDTTAPPAQEAAEEPEGQAVVEETIDEAAEEPVVEPTEPPTAPADDGGIVEPAGPAIPPESESVEGDGDDELGDQQPAGRDVSDGGEGLPSGEAGPTGEGAAAGTSSGDVVVDPDGRITDDQGTDGESAGEPVSTGDDTGREGTVSEPVLEGEPTADPVGETPPVPRRRAGRKKSRGDRRAAQWTRDNTVKELRRGRGLVSGAELPQEALSQERVFGLASAIVEDIRDDLADEAYDPNDPDTLPDYADFDIYVEDMLITMMEVDPELAEAEGVEAGVANVLGMGFSMAAADQTLPAALGQYMEQFVQREVLANYDWAAALAGAQEQYRAERDDGDLEGEDEVDFVEDESPDILDILDEVQGETFEEHDEGKEALYVPEKAPGVGDKAQSHPALMVQSTVMATAKPPELDYELSLASEDGADTRLQDAIEEGKISDLQVERAARGGQAHEQVRNYQPLWFYLVGRAGTIAERLGYMLADGTGMGKTRSMLAMVLDNINKGRKKHVWVSINTDGAWQDLVADTADKKGEAVDLGLSAYSEANPQGEFFKVTAGKKLPDEGVAFVSYSGLGRSYGKWQVAYEKFASEGHAVPDVYYPDLDIEADGRQALPADDAVLKGLKKVNLKGWDKGIYPTLVNWMSTEFEGLILFDESHRMKDFGFREDTRTGEIHTQGSSTSQAGVGLARYAPNARAVYASATPAAEARNLQYAERLGLFGREGVLDIDHPMDLVRMLEHLGKGAMEVLSYTLRKFGLYDKVDISLKDVEYESEMMAVTGSQDRLYTAMTEMTRDIYDHAVMAVSDGRPLGNTQPAFDRSDRTKFSNQFHGFVQRFYGNLQVSFMMPEMIEKIQRDVANGLAPVVQVANTGEAIQDRELARMDAADFTPAEQAYHLNLTITADLFDFINNHHPVARFILSGEALDEASGDAQVLHQRAADYLADLTSDMGVRINSIIAGEAVEAEGVTVQTILDKVKSITYPEGLGAATVGIDPKVGQQLVNEFLDWGRSKVGDQYRMTLNDWEAGEFASAGTDTETAEANLWQQLADQASPADSPAVKEFFRLASREFAPKPSLQQLQDAFGERMVEMSGRSVRLKLEENNNGEMELVRTSSSSKTREADLEEFMDADAANNNGRHILVFSKSGATGRSYHAATNRGNNRKRVHYLLQLPWAADEGLQGLGRTHRANQHQPPILRIMDLDMPSRKRFLGMFKKRIEELGAISTGQADSKQASLIDEGYDVFSRYGEISFRMFKDTIRQNHLDFFLSTPRADISLKQFLNRLMALPLAEQRMWFDQFQELLQQNVDSAKASGTYDIGKEDIMVQGPLVETGNAVVRAAKALGREARTIYQRFNARLKPNPNDLEALLKAANDPSTLRILEGSTFVGSYYFDQPAMVWRQHRGVDERMFYVIPSNGPIRVFNSVSVRTDKQVLNSYPHRGIEVFSAKEMVADPETEGGAVDVEPNLETIRQIWDSAVNNASLIKRTFHLLTGSLSQVLKLWNSGGFNGQVNVKRLRLQDGSSMIGVAVPSDDVDRMARRLVPNVGQIGGIVKAVELMKKGVSMGFGSSHRPLGQMMMLPDREGKKYFALFSTNYNRHELAYPDAPLDAHNLNELPVNIGEWHNSKYPLEVLPLDQLDERTAKLLRRKVKKGELELVAQGLPAVPVDSVDLSAVPAEEMDTPAELFPTNEWIEDPATHGLVAVWNLLRSDYARVNSTQTPVEQSEPEIHNERDILRMAVGSNPHLYQAQTPDKLREVVDTILNRVLKSEGFADETPRVIHYSDPKVIRSGLPNNSLGVVGTGEIRVPEIVIARTDKLRRDRIDSIYHALIGGAYVRLETDYGTSFDAIDRFENGDLKIGRIDDNSNTHARGVIDGFAYRYAQAIVLAYEANKHHLASNKLKTPWDADSKAVKSAGGMVAALGHKQEHVDLTEQLMDMLGIKSNILLINENLLKTKDLEKRLLEANVYSNTPLEQAVHLRGKTEAGGSKISYFRKDQYTPSIQATQEYGVSIITRTDSRPDIEAFYTLPGVPEFPRWKGLKPEDLENLNKLRRQVPQEVQVLLHELGHYVEDMALATADQQTRESVDRAHQRWETRLRANMSTMSVSQFRRAVNPVFFDEALDPDMQSLMATDIYSAEDLDYALSKEEWFANNVYRWFTSEGSPKTVMDKFFQGVADALKKMFAKAMELLGVSEAEATAEARDFLQPDAAVKALLDGMALTRDAFRRGSTPSALNNLTPSKTRPTYQSVAMGQLRRPLESAATGAERTFHNQAYTTIGSVAEKVESDPWTTRITSRDLEGDSFVLELNTPLDRFSEGKVSREKFEATDSVSTDIIGLSPEQARKIQTEGLKLVGFTRRQGSPKRLRQSMAILKDRRGRSVFVPAAPMVIAQDYFGDLKVDSQITEQGLQVTMVNANGMPHGAARVTYTDPSMIDHYHSSQNDL